MQALFRHVKWDHISQPQGCFLAILQTTVYLMIVEPMQISENNMNSENLI